MIENNKSLRRDVFLLLLLILPFLLAFLGARGLNVPDEGRYPEVAREMWLTGDFVTPKVNGVVFLDKPALYYWLQAASYQVFGVHEWSIRLMPALFGALGTVLVFIAGWKLFSRRAAWLAAAVFVCNPLYFLSSQYANLDLEVAVWITAALVAFALAHKQPVNPVSQRWLLRAAWAAMGLAVLTKGLIGLVFPGMIVVAWSLVNGQWRTLFRLQWLAGLAIFAAITLPWYLSVQQANPQFFNYFFIYQQFQRFSGTGFNNVFPFWFYVPILLVGLLPWSLFTPAALVQTLKKAWDKSDSEQSSSLFVLLWFGLILAFFSIPASKIVGYILPVVPPLALITGAHIDRRWNNPKGTIRYAYVVAALCALIALPLLFMLVHSPEKLLKNSVDNGWLLGKFWLLFAVFFVAGALALWRKTRLLWSLLVVGVGFPLMLALIAGDFNPKSIKPLALELAPMAKPHDVIVTYHDYYQDLPLYLNRADRIQVVDNWQDENIMKVDNWRREFYLALKHQPDAKQWLIDEAAFAALFQQGRQVYVLAPNDYVEKLLQRYPLQLVKRSGTATLLKGSLERPNS